MASPLTLLTDDELVERVPVDAPGDRIWQQAPYLLEMQRRLLIAVREASAAAVQQAKETNTLNVRMFALTFAVGLLTFVQACTAVVEFVQRGRN